MRKYLAVGIIILLLVGVNVSGGFVKDTKEVSTTCFDGNILYVGGSGPNNYTKIQDAIDDAVDGDTVFVYDDSAPYIEVVLINKSINFIGEDKNTTIIDAGPNDEHTIRTTADNVTITGFKVGNATGGHHSIYLASDNNLVYENNVDYKLRTLGIGIRGDSNIVKDNLVSAGNGAGVGISIVSGYFNVVDNNHVIGLLYGMKFEYCDSGDSNLIINNTVERSGKCGVLLYRECVNFVITQNHLFSLDEVAIKLDSTCENNIISYNIIENSGTGVFVAPVNDPNNNNFNNIIEYNRFDSNNVGVNFCGSCDINHNTFLSNDNHISFTFKHYWLQFIISSSINSNYWNRTRILPYPVSGELLLFSHIYFEIRVNWKMFDWHPASEPYDI